jgi:hypothetical protein
MVKGITACIFLIFSMISSAQEMFIRAGTLKASATISPSLMLNRSIQNVYINGFVAYQLDERLSLRGETFYYINGAADAATDILYNGAIHTYFGVFYHARIGNWDNYLGFQPGLSVTSIPLKSGSSAGPSFAAKAGTAYYVWKYFHFFAELTYMNNNVRGIPGGTMRMDELMLSAGLGFHINTRKE